MVTQYGMSDKFGMMCLATTENQYLDNRAGLICGEETAAQIDGEVLSIINKCYDDAMQLLIENRESLDKISEYLYEHETITGKEFMKIFREIKGIPEPEEESGKKSFMEQALAGKPDIPFRIPNGIRLMRVNYNTGKPATPKDRSVIVEALKPDFDFDSNRQKVIGGGEDLSLIHI
mgnify:CR=1 FL=1